jgi:hypothetical protein
VVTGDVDRDGDPDLVVSNKESNNISVLLNDGAGDFPALINLALAEAPDYAIIPDLNADGNLDVVAVHFANATCSVFMNQTPPYAGDCNHDGVPDSCEIQAGTSRDLNNNGVPDECDRLGDLNADGAINDLDLGVLIAVLLDIDTAPTHVAAADMDGSGNANGLDITPFLTLFVSGY